MIAKRCKRTLITALRILLFLVGFVSAVWFFLPWREAGRFVMSAVHSQLGKMNMRVGWSDVSGEADGFTVHNLTLRGMANFSFSSMTFRPCILASVLSFAPVSDITFSGGNVQLGAVLNLGDGGVLVTAQRSETLFENLRSDGDFAINGYMTVNLETMKIVRAEARIEKVPETFAENMGMLKNFSQLPLVEEGDGWYLRRK